MKDWVKEKLDRIEELFPPERLEASKRRWTDVWSGKLPVDRIPFTCGIRMLDYYNDLNAVSETDERLRVLLDECIFHGQLKDDFIPSLFPGCKQSTIPNMLGAEEIVVDNDYSTKKLIKDVEDIDGLPEPSMAPGAVAHDWLERQRYWMEETEGRIPIHVTDMQGPMDISGQLWGYDELFMAAYSEPGKVHLLLSKISDAFIMFWKRQQELLGEHFVGTHLWGWSWVPENNGAALSADSIVMVSPDFFDDFFEPVISRIGDELGGVTLHSCGQFGHLMGNIQTIPCLKGINSTEMTLEKLQESGLEPDRPLIFRSTCENAFPTIERIKRTGQPVDITIPIYPDHLLRGRKEPDDWSQEDWNVINERQDKLIDAMSF